VEVILLVAAVAFPLYFSLSAGGALQPRDFASAQSALEAIDTASRQVVEQGGEVLFLNQRHLLTFDKIKDVPLVPDYELVFLMEMAMANNLAYLDEFHENISDQRYTMIVSEPLPPSTRAGATVLGGKRRLGGARCSPSCVITSLRGA
jgi:hypothetical protein